MHNTKDNFTQHILQKIEDEHITPIPRWRFVVHHTLLWVPGACVTLIGAFAWAGLLFGIEHAGLEYQSIAASKLRLLVKTIPLIWATSFLLFTAVIVKTLRMTPKGYTFNSRKILGASLGISIICGTMLYIIDMRVYQNPIIRYPVLRQQKELWSHPESGRIAGLVSIEDDGAFLTDLNGKEWLLNTVFLSTTTTLRHETMFRIVGKKIDEDNFLVCAIFPWKLSSVSPRKHLTPPQNIFVSFSTSTQVGPCNANREPVF
ncbi:MAG: hypothetical protein NTV02_03895 [Candidatus Zambryskibacteria bacterium]|nr:hypothetical protein [Candidatus Zambryskibacteria bacterium]